MFHSLPPHESQHARPPGPSPTPGVYSNSCPLSRGCHPAISSSVVPSPPARNPSQHQGLFKWVNSSHFSLSICPFNEHPGLISFRMDWLDLLAVQGTLKSLLQNHSSKASVLQCSAFFTVQLSHPYMTTGKTIALTRWTFVGNGVLKLRSDVLWLWAWALASDFLHLNADYAVYSEKAMAPHSSTLAWKIPWMEEPGRLQSMGWLRVGHDWATSLSLFTFMHWRRKWQPTPVFLPGESQGQWSLMGCRL